MSRVRIRRATRTRSRRSPCSSSTRRDACFSLAGGAFEPDEGLWDTIGGFLDEDEDADRRLHREVREETGLEVEVGDFVGAFSDRYGDGEDAPTALNLVWEARIDERRAAAGRRRLGAAVVRRAAALPDDGELAFRWIAPALRVVGVEGAVDAREAEGRTNRPFG